MPAFARSWPSSRPDGPAPTIATWVRVRVVMAGSIPWRRFASAAAGDAMNASSACAASGCRARAPTAAENVVTIWIAGGSGPSTSMPVDVNQLRELLKAELHLAARDQRADGNARRRRDDPIPDLARRCPSARTAVASCDAARAGRGRRSCAPPARRAGARPRCRSPAAARRRAPRPRRPSARDRPSLPATRWPADEQLVDRVASEHDDVERLAGLHARGGVDAADRLDHDIVPRADLVGASPARRAPPWSPSTRCP